MAPACVIGVDLGGTKVLAGAVDGDLQVVARARRAVRGLDRDGVLGAVVAAVREAGSGAGVAVGDTVVCVGFPGFLDAEGRAVRRCVHHPLEGMHLREDLARELATAVLLDNDANCAATAEARAGAGRGAARMLLLTVGTGIGGAIVLDGVPDGGLSRAAGEFGHMSVDLGGPICACGSRGCLEMLASGPALVRAAVEHGWSDEEAITGALVTERALAGDAVAVAAAGQVGRALGAGIANLVNAFDPDVVVVGGGVLGLGDLLLEPARAEARARALAGERVRVEAATYGAEAGMMGAAMLAWDATR